MISYLLLFALLGIIALGVLRASRNPPARRRHQEPFVNERNPAAGAEMLAGDLFADEDDEIIDDIEEEEYVGKVVTRSAPSAETIAPSLGHNPAANLKTIAKYQHTPEPTAADPKLVDMKALNATTAEPMPSERLVSLNDFIILNLFTDPARPYRGYELLQALLTAGLRYGKRHVFHRYEDLTGRGKVLFSLASAVEPGVFDLPNMGSFSSPGLTMFMQISTQNNAAAVFEMLLGTAKELTDGLGGAVYDERRLPLTEEKVAQWRMQLQALMQEEELEA